MRKMANDLLYRFEAEFFQNEGVYSRNVNLVLAFDDYVRGVPDEDIAAFLGDAADVSEFRKMISCGIDMWLDGSSVKTLCLR